MKPKINLLGCLCACVFCILFTLIYYQFSHEVYSKYMTFMWAIPFVLGVIPYAFMTLKKTSFRHILAAPIYNSGIATLTVGSCFLGVLEIFGTTNSLSIIYLYVGIILLISGISLMLTKGIQKD